MLVICNQMLNMITDHARLMGKTAGKIRSLLILPEYRSDSKLFLFLSQHAQIVRQDLAQRFVTIAGSLRDRTLSGIPIEELVAEKKKRPSETAFRFRRGHFVSSCVYVSKPQPSTGERET